MESLQNSLHAACVVDQKDLNETVVGAIAAVARQSIHDCAELFGITVRLAQRFASMALQGEDRHSVVDPLADLATTPTALWRVHMTLDDVAQMQRGRAAAMPPHLERYRPLLKGLNEQVVLMLLRYATQPRLAALMSGLGSREVMEAMSSAGCSTLVQSAGHLAHPLVSLTLNEVYLDRVFSTLSGLPVDPTMRSLVARTLCRWEDCVEISEALDRELAAPRPVRVTKIGRPTAVFLPPGEADTIRQLIAHGVSTKAILQFTRSEVNSAQVRRLRKASDDQRPEAPDDDAADPALPRTHDSNAAVWGSAVRRLLVTSIFAHQRVLVSLGLPPHAAFVEAYEFYAMHHRDPANPLSLSRLISAVFTPLQDGLVHLGHCSECNTMHLSHDGHHNGIECPVCALAKFNKLGRPSSFRAGSWGGVPRARSGEALMA